MHKEVQFPQSQFSPASNFFYPIIQTPVITGCIGPYISDKSGISRKSHVQHVPSSRGVDDDMGNTIGLQKPLEFIRSCRIGKPIGMSHFHRQRDFFWKTLDERYYPVEIFGMEVVWRLKEGHSKLFLEMTDGITKFFRLLFYILQPIEMAYELGDLGEKLKIIRCLCGPGSHLLWARGLVEGGI